MNSSEIPGIDREFAAALASHDLDRATELLGRGAAINRIWLRTETFDRDVVEESTTHLMDAATQGDEARVAFLLEHGADPNIASQWSSRTALTEAARFGHAGVVDLLLAHGADVAAVDGYSHRTALGYVTEKVDPPIVRSLLRAGARPTFHRLGFSIDGGSRCREVIQALVDHGGSIDEYDDWGRTPLMWAVQYAELETIRLMIRLGADVRAKSRPNMNGVQSNDTPLALAKRRAEVKAELVRHGARER